MQIDKKDATVTATDGAGPGEFHVILSAQTLDRDGEVLTSDTWKTPLPEHITFDTDHGMDVRSTVGSGKPFINPDTGNLEVKGTFSSLARAQEVRTLINEGHIKTTSVAFMREKSQKAGKTVETRELLNGAFVAIPSNREAVVLAAKDALGVKIGARNNGTDAKHIQAIHDHTAALGAACASGGEQGHNGDGDGDPDTDAQEAEEKKSLATKAAGPDPAVSAAVLAVDHPLTQAEQIIPTINRDGLPPEVVTVLNLALAAGAANDKVLAALGIADPAAKSVHGSAVASDDISQKDAAAAAQAAAAAEVSADDIAVKARSIALLANL